MTSTIGNYIKFFGLISLYALFPVALSSVSPILSSGISMIVYYGVGIVMLVSAFGEDIAAWRKQAQDHLGALEMENDSDMFVQSDE